jgi:hypothetical protein
LTTITTFINTLQRALQRAEAAEQPKNEAKMNSLHNYHTWEMVSAHQAELLKEMQNEHLAQMATEGLAKTNWLSQLLHRPTHSPTVASSVAINSNATPELS